MKARIAFSPETNSRSRSWRNHVAGPSDGSEAGRRPQTFRRPSPDHRLSRLALLLGPGGDGPGGGHGRPSGAEADFVDRLARLAVHVDFEPIEDQIVLERGTDRRP